MDPISGLLTMLILIAFAYGMYLAYQKFVIEGGLFDTPAPEPIESVEPAQAPSIWDVPGVQSVRGRPDNRAVFGGTTGNDGTVYAANSILYYGGNEKLLGNGRAKTASVCYEASKARGINNWGWDRNNKSCFAYVDSNILTAMSDPNKFTGKADYAVGCTQPGVSPLTGCIDFREGNVVRGNKSNNFAQLTRSVSFDQCRKISRDSGYDMFMYTTNRQNWVNPAVCWGINDTESVRGFTGNNSDVEHMNACADPSKKIVNACE